MVRQPATAPLFVWRNNVILPNPHFCSFYTLGVLPSLKFTVASLWDKSKASFFLWERLGSIPKRNSLIVLSYGSTPIASILEFYHLGVIPSKKATLLSESGFNILVAKVAIFYNSILKSPKSLRFDVLMYSACALISALAY